MNTYINDKIYQAYFDLYNIYDQAFPALEQVEPILRKLIEDCMYYYERLDDMEEPIRYIGEKE